MTPSSNVPARVPNEIIVRFKSARSLGLAAGQRRAAGGALRDLPQGVRDAHARFGVRTVRRVLRNEGGIPPLTRRRMSDRPRGRRGDERQASGVREEMERTVVLSVDSREELGRILNAYRALPDVEMAEEN